MIKGTGDFRVKIALCALTLGAALLGGCGSSGPPQASNAVGVCQQISAVLSDGPDPAADPVGYAEAQILPLRQIHTPDTSLQRAIDDLASAYQEFSNTNGAKAAQQEVTGAGRKVNAICPGAVS